jgi:hypothetical protein
MNNVLNNVLQPAITNVKQMQRDWLSMNQRSVLNLELVDTRSETLPHAGSHASAVTHPVSDPDPQAALVSASVQKRANFMRQFSPAMMSPVVTKPIVVKHKTTAATSVNTQSVVHQQQDTGVALDSIVTNLFQVLANIPQDEVRVLHDADIGTSQVRMQGVRMISAGISPYHNISREVPLCLNVHSEDEQQAVRDVHNCCKTVSTRCAFPHSSMNGSVVSPYNVGHIEQVDLLQLCAKLPLSYSPTFTMLERNIDCLRKSIAFSKKFKRLNVVKVHGTCTSSNCKDTIVLTPRQLGGNLLYTVSLFTEMNGASMKDTHVLHSMHSKLKHPRFGVSLGHHMDATVAHVHDKAHSTVKTWLRTLCKNDRETYNLLVCNKHAPTVHLKSTEHCAYMSPCDGVTLFIQNNDFAVSAPALIRYGLHDKTDHTMTVSLVSVLFHGPTIHKM